MNDKLVLEFYSLFGLRVSDVTFNAEDHVFLNFTRKVERTVGFNSGNIRMFSGHS